MLNDLLTIKKIKEGDILTFENVFRQYYTPLYLYSFSIIGKQDAAEEIIQNLFYILWRDREKLNILRSLKNYLYRIVYNHSILYQRHQNVRRVHQDSVLSNDTEEQNSTPLEQLEYKELERIINETLKRLPERRLKIFRMHRTEGKKYKEIADILSISVKTVEAEMTKTYQVLRYEIEKYTHKS